MGVVRGLEEREIDHQIKEKGKEGRRRLIRKYSKSFSHQQVKLLM